MHDSLLKVKNESYYFSDISMRFKNTWKIHIYEESLDFYLVQQRYIYVVVVFISWYTALTRLRVAISMLH